MIRLLRDLLRRGGVDRAVFFSVAAQMARFITGPITLLLVVKQLTPEAQGYYYTFSSIVSMQVFLEMGFSQNIVQFASHEFGKLRLDDRGKLSGDPVALSRLISLGRLAFGYYGVASLLLMLGLGGGGYWFFATSEQYGVAWQTPWWIVAVASAGSLALNPAWALIEGCNQVGALAAFRFRLALTTGVVNILALLLGAGLFAPAIFAVTSLLISASWLIVRWKNFLLQFVTKPENETVSWKREIWPFQWRIAVSWMSGYFIFDVMNPVAFRFCGAVDAGRLGVSFQLIRIVMATSSLWFNTKIPRFGMLVANRAWPELDALWRRCTAQAAAVYLLGFTALLVALPLAQHFAPGFALRLATVEVFVALGFASLAQVIIGSMACELRAHRREPYMLPSVFSAALCAVLIIPLSKLYGIFGIACGYAISTLLTSVPATWIYLRKRIEYRRLA